jgi:hypothetical protein
MYWKEIENGKVIGFGISPEINSNQIEITKEEYEEILNTNNSYSIEDLKGYKITESKIKLEEYLESHPFLFSDGKYYSCTEKKQNQLMGVIAVYNIKTEAGDTTAKLEWNATGEVCRDDWTIEEISTLAVGIYSHVKPLVTRQQEIEVEIKACSTNAELDSVVINYDGIVN